MSKYLVIRKSVLDGSIAFKASKYSYSWNPFPKNAYAYTLEGAKSVVRALNSRPTGLFFYNIEQI